MARREAPKTNQTTQTRSQPKKARTTTAEVYSILKREQERQKDIRRSTTIAPRLTISYRRIKQLMSEKSSYLSLRAVIIIFIISNLQIPVTFAAATNVCDCYTSKPLFIQTTDRFPPPTQPCRKVTRSLRYQSNTNLSFGVSPSKKK